MKNHQNQRENPLLLSSTDLRSEPPCSNCSSENQVLLFSHDLLVNHIRKPIQYIHQSKEQKLHFPPILEWVEYDRHLLRYRLLCMNNWEKKSRNRFSGISEVGQISAKPENQICRSERVNKFYFCLTVFGVPSNQMTQISEQDFELQLNWWYIHIYFRFADFWFAGTLFEYQLRLHRPILPASVLIMEYTWKTQNYKHCLNLAQFSEDQIFWHQIWKCQTQKNSSK